MDVQLLQAKPFAISPDHAGPLLRLELLHDSEERSVVVLSAARLALDPFSLGVYGRALWDAYASPGGDIAASARWDSVKGGARVDNVAQAEAAALHGDARGLQAAADFWFARERESHGEHRRLPRPRFFLNARSSSATVSRRFRLSRSNLTMFQALLVLPPHCPIGEKDVCFVTAYSVLAVLTAYLTQQDNFVLGHTLSSSPEELGAGVLGPFQQVGWAHVSGFMWLGTAAYRKPCAPPPPLHFLIPPVPFPDGTACDRNTLCVDVYGRVCLHCAASGGRACTGRRAACAREGALAAGHAQLHA